MQSTPPSERFRYLDLLRGFALLGILPANIPAFGLPSMTSESPAAVSHGALREYLALYATRFLVDYKFITLFSLLFGAGIMLLRERAAASGRSFAAVMTRRLGALWLVGIAHAVFLWWGDIVTYYAPLGLVLCWASTWRPRTLQWVGLVLLLLPAVAMLAVLPVLVVLSSWPPTAAWLDELRDPGTAVAPPHAATGSWSEFWAGITSWDPQFERAVYAEGGFLRITLYRTFTWLAGFLLWGWYFVWRLAGLFFLGMAWVKAGWLQRPAENRDRFAALAGIGLAVGVPCHVLSCLVPWGERSSPAAAVLSEWAQYVGSLGLAAAYAAAVAHLALRERSSGWLAPVEAVGRTAFSNYLLQSLLCTLIFYSYGLGLFGTLDRAQLLGVVLAVWALQLVVSPLWLRFFRLGPVEWLWRSATYWEWQRFRA